MKLEYQLIKEKNDCCVEIEQFENLLKINQELQINTENKTIRYKEVEVKYNIKKQETNELDEIIFIVSFEYEVKEITEKDIEYFEKFDNKFLHTISSFNIDGKGFFKNTLIDDISSYYSNILYPQINLIENKLRKIIYIFMEKNLGSSWMKKSLPVTLNKDVNKKFEERGVSSNENDYLINVDFISLGEFLFKEYHTGNINDVLAQIGDAANSESKEIRDKLNKIAIEYRAKSNYVRYFDNDLENNNLEKKWEELYKYRCDVAHNKRIRKSQYDKCIRLIKEIDSIFDKCIRKIDTIKVPEEEKTKLEDVGISVLSDKDKRLKLMFRIDNLKEFDGYYIEHLNDLKNASSVLPISDIDKLIEEIETDRRRKISRTVEFINIKEKNKNIIYKNRKK